MKPFARDKKNQAAEPRRQIILGSKFAQPTMLKTNRRVPGHERVGAGRHSLPSSSELQPEMPKRILRLPPTT